MANGTRENSNGAIFVVRFRQDNWPLGHKVLVSFFRALFYFVSPGRILSILFPEAMERPSLSVMQCIFCVWIEI